MLLRDELGTIYSDELFADVYPGLGQPAEQPWRLALVTVMQFMENYTDRQAAEAVRTRIDCKYVPPLRADRPGLRFLRVESISYPSVRERPRRTVALGPAGAVSSARLAAIRTINRLQCAGERLRATLNDLPGCARIPPVEVLRRVWVQQYYVSEDHVHWRADDDIPPASILISSPYDPEAHLSIKRSTVWTGDIRACGGYRLGGWTAWSQQSSGTSHRVAGTGHQ